MKPQSFIFIGRSGCGKGTQAKLLVDYLKKLNPKIDTLYIQTGQEFRNFISGDLHTQKLSKEIYLSDKLQPEFLSVYMWIKIVINNYNGQDNLIFDGTPRRRHEAGVLNSVFGFYNLPKAFVVYLDVSEEWAKEKLLSRKRMDDKEEDIAKRFAWFKTEVISTIDFYRDNNDYNFLHINGEGSIEEVFSRLLGKLKPFL